MNKNTILWSVIAVLVIVAVFLVDWSRYSDQYPTDEEINQLVEEIDSNQSDFEIGSEVDETIEADLSEFIE